MQYIPVPETDGHNKKFPPCSLEVRDSIVVVICNEIELGKLKDCIQEIIEAKSSTKSTCHE